MANVPAFSDIGKATNDLLGKDYPIGAAKLEVNTTTANGIVSTDHSKRVHQHFFAFQVY